MELISSCRGCAKILCSSEEIVFTKELAKMFTFCTNLKLEINDKLPKKFCQSCCSKIKDCYNYIVEAQNANNYLMKLLSENIENEKKEFSVKPVDNKEHEILLTERFDKNFSSTENYIELESKRLENICESNNNFKEINKDQSNTEETKFICTICQKQFILKVWLNKHVAKVHNSNRLFCLKCDKSFKNHKQLSDHQVTHIANSHFVCGSCGARYKTKSHLRTHIQTHSEKRPHKCRYCGMRLKFQLKSHLIGHKAKKEHLCDVCGASFNYVVNLKCHMRTHTGSKPFKCGRCAFACSSSSSLKRHEQRHTGVAKHICTYCEREFFYSHSLVRHMRTHTGDLPYKCPYCTRAFIDSWKRKTHLMRHHRLTLDEIPKMTKDAKPVT